MDTPPLWNAEHYKPERRIEYTLLDPYGPTDRAGNPWLQGTLESVPRLCPMYRPQYWEVLVRPLGVPCYGPLSYHYKALWMWLPVSHVVLM